MDRHAGMRNADLLLANLIYTGVFSVEDAKDTAGGGEETSGCNSKDTEARGT